MQPVIGITIDDWLQSIENASLLYFDPISELTPALNLYPGAKFDHTIIREMEIIDHTQRVTRHQRE